MTVYQKNTAQDLALLSNGTYGSGKGQAFDDYLWDTALVPSAPRQVQFFKVPIGGSYGSTAGDSKTEIETSMEDTGKLPAGQSFLITGITTSLVSYNPVSSGGIVTGLVDGIVSAYKLLMGSSVWELKFSNVEYSWRDSGSIFLPSVFEVGGSSAASAPASQQVGNFLHYNWVKVSTKVPVSELVSFSVNARFDAGNAAQNTALLDAFTFLNSVDCAIRVQLKGMLTRKV